VTVGGMDPALLAEPAVRAEVAHLADRLRGGADPVAWLGEVFDAGLAAAHWPAGHGGSDASRDEARHVEREFAAAGTPLPGPERNVIGLLMAAPTLIAHGADDQLDQWLRPLWTGEEIWCQLFSEPGAGSDLAGVATSAVRDGDAWVVTGQKVWNSFAHEARWGLLLARTDPSVPKHRGLTYFVCDMEAPGVDVRPLRQITGEAEFNEVFLTEVRIPDAHRIGDVGAGWSVATSTLMNERVSIAQGPPDRESGIIGHLARDWRAGDQPAELRHTMRELWIQAEVVRLLTIRLGQLAETCAPGPEGSALKLAYTDLQQRASSFWLDLIGHDGLRYTDWTMRRPSYGQATDRGAAYSYLRMRANSIEGGTSEILRGIVAERVLGLPGETRVDRDVPWKDLPR
jgi:alkylation response protein AidB-like acyl-CoA dehydrogenase